MSDSAARDRDAVETESAFSHPAVAPDATAAYGDHPDQVIDFYAPRDGRAGAPVVVVLHGGAWRAPYDRRHVTPFADFLARRGFAVANVEYRRGSELPQQRGSGPVAGRWPETSTTSPRRWTRCPVCWPSRSRQRRCATDRRHRALRGRAAGVVGRGPARTAAGSPWRPPRRRRCAGSSPSRRSPTSHGGGAGCLLRRGGPTPRRPEADFDARSPYADPAALLPTGIATAIVQGAHRPRPCRTRSPRRSWTRRPRRARRWG